MAEILGLDGTNIARPTNQEFINFCIDRSNFGPMTDIVMIEAIRFYTEMVTNTQRPEADPDALINPQAWYDCCDDLKAKVAKHYGG